MADTFAFRGFVYIDDTNPHTDVHLFALVPQTDDTVISSIAFPDSVGATAYSGDDNIEGQTLVQGLTYYVRAASITLSSGAIVGYLD